jgi:HEAT repeat protein
METVSELAETLAGGNKRARKKAIRKLREHNDDSQALRLLVDMLLHSEDELRPEAAGALGRFRHADAVDALSHVLRHVDEEGNESVPPAAAWSLGEIGDRRGVPALVELLKNRSDPEFLYMAYRHALFALGALGQRDLVEEFVADPWLPEEFREEAQDCILPRMQ